MAAALRELVHMRVVLSERFLVLVFFCLLVLVFLVDVVDGLVDMLDVFHVFVKMLVLKMCVV